MKEQQKVKELKFALIGYGGIARAHSAAYHLLKKQGVSVTLCAVCDRDAQQFQTQKTINLRGSDAPLPEGIRLYTDVDDLIRREDFDAADICLPSFLHKEFTVKLLRAGKHVLCEKPMALNSADCAEMVRTAREENRVLMIGQCLRFDPYYLYLKECVDTKKFGTLRHLTMKRLSEYPTWGAGRWFDSNEKCGGCILDTHIHDIDMARFLLGEPEAVSTVTYEVLPHSQLVNSRLFYKDAAVIADAAWDEACSVPFEAGYHAKFDDAAVVYDGESVLIYPHGGTPFAPEIPQKDRVAEEIRHFAALIRSESMENSSNPPESACASVRLIERLRESAMRGGERIAVSQHT